MVKLSGERLDQTFKALSDPTRRAIVQRLARGDAFVGELAEPFEMSWPAVSKHLRILERAGLVEQVREGTNRRCRLAAEPLQSAQRWIAQYTTFWEGKLDSLESYIARTAPKSAKRTARGAGRRKSHD